MGYWLFATDPDNYSWQNLLAEPNQSVCWEGVRNYKARNILRDQVKVGDLVLIYHSVVRPPVIPGIATVVREAYPDHNSWDPTSPFFDQRTAPGEARWVMVDIQAVHGFEPPITRFELKADPRLEDMMVIKPGQQVPIQPVLPLEWEAIMMMRSKKGERGEDSL